MNRVLADVRECAATRRLVEQELTASMRMARLAGATVRDLAEVAGIAAGKVHELTSVEGVLARALSAHAPVVRRLALVSGGADSSVLAHRCRDLVDELAHLDTGTALPGVRNFVMDYARQIGKPLRVAEAGDAFRRLVLGDPEWWELYRKHRKRGEGPDAYRQRLATAGRRAQGAPAAPLGFPGPAGHRIAYSRLKERSLERIVREVRTEFGAGAGDAAVGCPAGRVGSAAVHRHRARKLRTAREHGVGQSVAPVEQR